MNVVAISGIKNNRISEGQVIDDKTVSRSKSAEATWLNMKALDDVKGIREN